MTCYLLLSTNRYFKTRGWPVQASSLAEPPFLSVLFHKSPDSLPSGIWNAGEGESALRSIPQERPTE